MFDFVKKIIGKKEVYNINGRKIIIIDKTTSSVKKNVLQATSAIPSESITINPDALNKIKQKFLDFCKTSEVLIHFPLFNVFIVRKNERFLGAVDPDARVPNMYFNLTNLELLDSTTFDEQFDDILIHETTHLWHREIQAYRKLILPIHLRTLKATSINLTDLLHLSVPKLFLKCRIKLQSFFFALQSEGIASFVEYFTGNKRFHPTVILPGGYKEMDFEFSDAYFKFLYNIAEDDAKRINIFLSRFKNDASRNINLKKIAESFERLDFHLVSCMYSIGYHIIYSIIYLRKDISLERLAKMSPHKVISIYEDCIQFNRYSPIVTISSDKGIFDYNRSLAILNSVIKQISK